MIRLSEIRAQLDSYDRFLQGQECDASLLKFFHAVHAEEYHSEESLSRRQISVTDEELMMMFKQNCPNRRVFVARCLNLDSWVLGTDGHVMEAERRIVDAFMYNSPSLDLSGLGLNSLPVSLGRFKKLEELDCRGNELKELPDSIGNMRNLRRLMLEQNSLQELPKSIGKLSKLEVLDCNQNELEYFPQSLFHLEKLRELHFSQNYFESIPEEIRRLGNLVFLECMYNEIVFLPPSIGQLQRLETLLCDGNPLTTLPPEISQLRELKDLACNECLLESIPAEIGELRNLEFLTLASCNELHPLDDAVIQLRQYGCKIDLPQHLQVVHAPPQDVTDNPSFRKLLDVCGDPTLSGYDYSPLNRDRELADSINVWLNRCVIARDFEVTDVQPIFAARILSILRFALEHEEFKSNLRPFLVEATDSCSDRASLMVNHLELKIRFSGSRDLTPIQFYRLLRGAFAMEILEREARRKIPELLERNRVRAEQRGEEPNVPDEIEVYLGYQVQFREEFDLPIGGVGMKFLSCSDLTEEDFVEARDTVRRALDDPSAFLESTLERKDWKERLDIEFKKNKEKQRSLLDLEDRMNEAFDGEFENDQIRLDSLNRLKREYDQEERAWYRRKTEQVQRGMSAEEIEEADRRDGLLLADS